MKTVGEMIDELDRRIEILTANVLNADRAEYLRDRELHLRSGLVELRDFLTDDGTKAAK